MGASSWRLIPVRQDTGAFHMAADACLAGSESSLPALRLYRWQPPALSLGYHQSEKRINFKRCAEAGIDVVRRPTGGRAVLHADELTYAVVLPVHSPLASGGVHSVHNRISQALAEGIRQLGVNIELREQSDNLQEHYTSSSAGEICFSSSTKYELQINGKKSVGSAQRKFANTILQHGSILVGPAHQDIASLLKASTASQDQISVTLKSSTTYLQRHLAASPDLGELAACITRAFQHHFNCEYTIQDFTETEIRTIQASVQNYSLSTQHVSHHPA